MQTYLSMRNEALVRVLGSYLDESHHARVLDIGVGTGLSLAEVARTLPRLQCFGVDFSDTMLRQTANRLTPIGPCRLTAGDATQLPFADGSFDIVYATRFIHQFTDKKSVLAEFVRVLRPGGTAVIEFYNRPYHWFRYWTSNVKGPKASFFSHFPTRREVAALIGQTYELIPLRLAGARLVRAVIGDHGLRGLIRSASVFPLSAFVDEYFVIFRK